jgi:hypothetical protein
MRSARPETERLRADLDHLGLASAADLAASEKAMALAVRPGLAMPVAATPFRAAARRRLLTLAFAADRRLQRMLARPVAAPLQRAYGAVRRAARQVLAG